MKQEKTQRRTIDARAARRTWRGQAGLVLALAAMPMLPVMADAATPRPQAPPRAQGGQASGQAQPAPQPRTTRATPRPYRLTVSNKDGAIDLALVAEDAKLAAIGAELAQQLRARVAVGPELQQESITVTIPETPLEQALTSLAPRVLVDYEIRQGAMPVPKTIHLLSLTDREPQRNTEARGMSVGLLITGNTEDTEKTPEEDPLRVIGDKRFISIQSRQQPLADVARAISDVLGVPVEMKGDGAELVDLTLRDVPPEDAIPRLSPHVRLHVRVDVNSAERNLLRITVEPAEAR